MFLLSVTTHPVREEERDEPQAAAARLTTGWVAGYHSAEEDFFEEMLVRLAEREREDAPDSRLQPAD